MIVKPELVKKIKDYFGLNIYETKVWLALLGKGIASAGEVAELSSVPRSRTYDVLESLEKQGFAMAKLGKPVKYIAIKPTSVIEKLKNNTLKQAEERVFSLAGLKDTQEYNELESLHKEGVSVVKQEEMSTALYGRSNIYSHIREMLENSEKEIVLCMPAEELEARPRIFMPIFERLNKSNIKMKIALKGDEKDIKRIAERFKIKPTATSINSRFFISDSKQIVFMLAQNTPNDNNDIGIWLNSEFFASALVSMFSLAFKK